MADKLGNLCRFVTATTGTGTLTVGAAVSGFLTPIQSIPSLVTGDTVIYSIQDGANSECGRGTYDSTGPTLARAPFISTGGVGVAINLSGSAQVILMATAETFAQYFPLTGGIISGSMSATGSLSAGGATGFASILAGDATHAGYLALFKGDGATRLGYLGFSNTDYALSLENGANFTVNGGNAAFGALMILGIFTIATLPTGVEGGVAVITDQLTDPAAKGVAPTAGGSVKCAVIYLSGAWKGV